MILCENNFSTFFTKHILHTLYACKTIAQKNKKIFNKHIGKITR